MLMIVMMACTESGVNSLEQTVAIEEPGEMSLELVPPTLDFGVVATGSQGIAEVELHNTGDVDIFLTDLWTDSSGFEFAMEDQAIAPGDSQTLRSFWTPRESGELDETLTLSAGTSITVLSDVDVEMAGVAEGPQLYASIQSYDFGLVSVGCEEAVPLTVTNIGTTALTITDLHLSYDLEFQLADRYGSELPEFPWVLEPGEGQDVTLSYVPDIANVAATTLTVISDDPFDAARAIPANGAGYIEDDNRDLFDVTGKQNVTTIVAVNQIVIYGSKKEIFESSLYSLFNTLKELGPDYRIAFVGIDDGVVLGSHEYIDNDLTVEESVQAAIAMLEDVPNGDNDFMFRTLQNGIASNVDWLLEGVDVWETAKLNLLAINDDLEQTPGGNYVTFVEDYRQYKEDPEDVVVHAIGGDAPTGCPGADPMVGFHEAAELTGGLFLSVCEESWDDHMSSLAVAMLGRNQVAFPLSETPNVASLTVWVDDFEQTEGWTYNEDTNSVVFDRNYYPPTGSELEIYYLVGDCEQ